MNLDWSAIRPLNGSRSEGFEELCAQLARAESPSDAEFVRKGSPDAGVECYCVLADESEWGWQAKYFDTLGSAQWSQIDESVKTALDKHPNLVRYYVCVPLDRPDARVEGQTSAMQRWHEHVEKWEGWADDRGMTVGFVWWGASELLDCLTRPAHVGRVSFWFGELGLDGDWFERRLNRAVEAVGSRYTPEIHIDSPTTRELELFGRTEAAFDSIKALAPGIRDALSWVRTGARDSSADDSLQKLVDGCEDLLADFSAIELTPSGPCPFADIAGKIEIAISAAEKSIVLQDQRAREWDAKTQNDEKSSEYRHNPFRGIYNNLRSLNAILMDALSQVCNADEKCKGQLLVLTGEAGCGKTHLLCDLARERLAADAPTVLLMGQQFLSPEHPWTQARALLDIRTNTTEEFVGALEAAAQAANCRALVIIDALNEGNGRNIWPHHLGAFSEMLRESEWIGIVLAVRRNYQDILIPENVQKHAIGIEHLGFAGQEYEAAEAFFSHYDIKFTSVPILNPEFQRPLFLKTLCEGLKDLGKRELPAGFQGVTQIFDLYLHAVNKRLADRLDYDRSDNLVRRALEKLAEGSLDADTQWIAPGQARDAVDAFLPGRSCSSKSLFQGLISEGVLIKDLVVRSGEIDDEVVYIVYERFADHIAADLMLRAHVDPERPVDAFSADGELHWVRQNWSKMRHGLIEALCIQVPERTGRELFELLPEFHRSDGLGWLARDAFRQSLIWRRTDAFTDATLEIVNECMSHDGEWEEMLDTLLMVSTIAEHPFNARLLDRNLSRMPMPERDAFWSVYLHHSWGNQSPVDRLVGWASRISAKDTVDGQMIGLCAIVLAWMFTTSNRFLRDRATKALVSLLTGRLDAAERLVERFAEVDDPYVAERVYAVAYGVAMRSDDAESVGRLAEAVYDKAFAAGSPPPHILLRDYARGVVDRAIALGARQSFDRSLFRPPYSSDWPVIPGDEQVKPLRAETNSIAMSVFDGDFGRYVIGSGSWSSGWSSIPLNADGLSSEGQLIHQGSRDHGNHRDRIRELDHAIIHRYVVWRAFDLGWNQDVFGDFDRMVSGAHWTRRADKPERIGKKYQWIAYHEILAYISDHYQFQDGYEAEGSQKYDGPWQLIVRDIDPSCTLLTVPGSASSNNHSRSWWCQFAYDDWRDDLDHREWLNLAADIPNVADLLKVRDSSDRSDWLNLSGYFSWRQRHPLDMDANDVERREFWLICTGYFVQEKDLETFMDWASKRNFMGQWMPDPVSVMSNGSVFLGEFLWSPAYRYVNNPYYGMEEWARPGRGCSVPVRLATVQYNGGARDFDCSVSESYTLRLPHHHLVESSGLRWSGRGADFMDRLSKLAALDPTAHEDGPPSALIRQDVLEEYLAKQGLALCWTIVGEKEILGRMSDWRYHGSFIVSGAYALTNGGLVGGLRQFFNSPSPDAPGRDAEPWN